MDAIRSSHIIHLAEKVLANTPVYNVADPLDLLLVDEAGNHHLTLLDGANFEPIHRFNLGSALHGRPGFSPEGRFVYLASEDGWISKYDLYTLTAVAKIRAGIQTRNLAVSADGRYIMVANSQPHTLLLLNAQDLSPIKLFIAKDNTGITSRVSAVYTAAPRESYIVALKDIAELWEISYATEPPPGFGMWVHDYRVDSGEKSTPEPFPVRKIKVADFLDDFCFDQDYISVIGISGTGKPQVVDMDIGRVIVPDLKLPGQPQPASGTHWEYQDRTLLAAPDLAINQISLVDMDTWELVTTIETLGPGASVHSHENSAYAWVYGFSGTDKDAVLVIDKRSLEIIKTLRPSPGQPATQVEFSRDGNYALLGIEQKEGAVIVYNAVTLEQIKRIPAHRPAGIYSLYREMLSAQVDTD